MLRVPLVHLGERALHLRPRLGASSSRIVRDSTSRIRRTSARSWYAARSSTSRWNLSMLLERVHAAAAAARPRERRLVDAAQLRLERAAVARRDVARRLRRAGRPRPQAPPRWRHPASGLDSPAAAAASTARPPPPAAERRARVVAGQRQTESEPRHAAGGRARGCRARACTGTSRAGPDRGPFRRISCSRWPRTCVGGVAPRAARRGDSRGCERNAGKFSFCSNEDMGSGAQLWGTARFCRCGASEPCRHRTEVRRDLERSRACGARAGEC